jgi:tetratricopeptide (TPR) repeat protein
MRRFIIAIVAILSPVSLIAQGLTLPPSGENQKASVTQHIGPVTVTIDYSSPDVHAPNGDDRRGKIWGTDVVHYGFKDEAFGTCTQCPWRAGANENTVFTVSHDVKIEGQPLPAGSYGLHLAAAKEGDWTLIFSKNHTSWGSYFYDPAEDALRVSVKPAKSEYNEWLTYEFTDRKPDQATVALKWEDLQIPWTIKVDDVTALYLTRIREELRNSPGFTWQNWVGAANYALSRQRANDALEFAQGAITFTGMENFQTLTALANAEAAAGKTAESAATRQKALSHRSAGPIEIHGYARQLLAQGKKEEALRVWELNAKRYPNEWPVNVGMARGLSANGRYKDAIKYAKLAIAQAPDEGNRQNLQAGLKKLEEGKDMNQ